MASTTLCIKNASPSFIEFDESNGFYQVYRVQELLDAVKSQYQDIKVYSTLNFGNILIIDNALMITQRDEFHYHEMIAHVPLNYNPAAAKVVVIGGGDGGTVLQVLKHYNVEQVIHVEIDSEVLRLSKKHFPQLAAGYQDHRYEGIVSDGAKWMEQAAGPDAEKHDLVLVDSTDFNAAQPLFTEKFYKNVKRALAPGGIFVFNIDSPSWHLNDIAVVTNLLQHVFKFVFLYQVWQPTYTSGHYAYVFCSDYVHPLKASIDWKAFEAKMMQLDYYTPQVHDAAFALPGFVRQVVPAIDGSMQRLPANRTC